MIINARIILLSYKKSYYLSFLYKFRNLEFKYNNCLKKDKIKNTMPKGKSKAGKPQKVVTSNKEYLYVKLMNIIYMPARRSKMQREV